MKANIDVKDRREADAIKLALEDSAVRAFVVVMGTLKSLPTDRARRRVLQYVHDRLEEESELEQAAATNGGNTGTEDRGA
jgi:hypothetical protein